jgi:peptide/nickel transport system permease protein
MKKIVHFPFIILTSAAGLLFFLSFPKLFDFRPESSEHLGFKFLEFLKAFAATAKQLFQTEIWLIVEKWIQPTVIDRYTYSLAIILISLAFTIFIGSCIAYILMSLSFKKRAMFKHVLNFIEGLPDLLVIFIIQMSLFALYRDYGIRLVTMYGLAGKEPLIFPMMINSLLPSLFFAQYLLKVMEEEYEKHYILLGQAKGMSNLHILFIHLTRNILPVISIHFKTIIFMVTTNLVLVEQMFVLNGYTKELYNLLTKSGSPMEVLFYAGLFLIPVMLLERIVTLTGKKTASARGLNI